MDNWLYGLLAVFALIGGALFMTFRSENREDDDDFGGTR